MSITIWLVLVLVFAIGLYIHIKLKYDTILLQTQSDLDLDLEHFTSTPAILMNTPHNITIYTGNFEELCSTYIETMNRTNQSARAIGSLDSTANKYETSNALDEVTKTEYTYINKAINTYITQICRIYSTPPNEYPNICKWLRELITVCEFAKGNDTLEGGMPHTHGNVIIMDQKWWSTFRPSTLIHELAHIDQRQRPEFYNKLYDLWGFTQMTIQNGGAGFDTIFSCNRHNPDGDPQNDIGITGNNTQIKQWIWHTTTGDNTATRFFWVGAVFNTTTPTDLHNVAYVAYEMMTGITNGTVYYNGSQAIALDSFKEFNAFFGGRNDVLNANNYHPNEIAAHYLDLYFNQRIKFKNAKYPATRIFTKLLEKLT